MTDRNIRVFVDMGDQVAHYEWTSSEPRGPQPGDAGVYVTFADAKAAAVGTFAAARDRLDDAMATAAAADISAIRA